jgi:hypothetical protein
MGDEASQRRVYQITCQVSKRLYPVKTSKSLHPIGLPALFAYISKRQLKLPTKHKLIFLIRAGQEISAGKGR